VRDVVITVPAYFDDAQRRATLEAGERAGLQVLRLLNEPTSASLVYDQLLASQAASTDVPEILLVYDLGGGTFDVSVLEVFHGVREVRATTGNTHLGGDDFDEKLVQLFLDELKGKQGVDPREDMRAMARLRRLAEETKIRLSSDISVHVREEFLTSVEGKPVHLELEVRRRTFEELIEPLLESTVALARRALEEARLEGQPLSRVCLVGGSTRIPRVRQLLEEAFGVDIHEEVDPDLAVGLGAAVQAGLLTGEPVERLLVDVAAHSLGIRVMGVDERSLSVEPDTFAPVLRRNSVLPAVRVEEFYTTVPEQESVLVEVFQGEAPRVSENTRVGSFGFALVPQPANSPVRVEFSYDLNGVVKVSVSQPGTANTKTVALSVADAGKGAQASRGQSAVERKGRTLLERLAAGPRAGLERLLEQYAAAEGLAKERAEEALLDFFLEHEVERQEP